MNLTTVQGLRYSAKGKANADLVMRLIDLEPSFLKYLGDGSSQYIDDLNSADGLIFLCPKCLNTNNGKIGTHSIICWFLGKVPEDVAPKPGRWTPSGTCYEDLSFVPPNSPSILLTNENGCKGHWMLENGIFREV